MHIALQCSRKVAVELIRSNQSLSRLASRIGYGRLEAFSRAFTRQFGETPTAWRETRQTEDETVNESFLAMLPTETKEYNKMYDVEIKNFASLDWPAWLIKAQIHCLLS